MTRTRTAGDRAEGVVQVVILLTIGGVAAAASFTHVHNVAAQHGQPGWLAWADAVVLELMSIGTGLEIRRRHRAGRPAGFVLAVLVAAVALSLAAQVVEAEPSVVGWLAAALPALGFLACVKIVLSRTVAETAPAPPSSARTLSGDAVPNPTGNGSAAVPAPATARDDPDDAEDEQDVSADLLALARQAATAHLAEHGRPITRDQLRAQLRTGTNTATVLHRQVRHNTRPGLLPIPADAFTRVNGATAREEGDE
jgi:hypothetical protein